MVIQPEVFVTPDRPVVSFREPREKVDLAVELPKVLHSQGWGAGTYFHVQFIGHDRSELLASAEFLVTQVTEGLHTSEANPYQPITKTVFMRKYEQISQWWPKPAPAVFDHEAGNVGTTEIVQYDTEHAPARRGRPPKVAVS